MILNAWDILRESAVFILVGFLFAGLLEALLPASRVVRLLSASRPRSVFLATLIGVPLPLCSCSVLPTAVALKKKGASKGSILAFLISTPETSITSVLLTYGLLGPVMAIFRPLAACVTAITAGLVENRFKDDVEVGEVDQAACGHDHDSEVIPGTGATFTSRLHQAMRHAFVDLLDDIFGWVMIGIVVAAALQSWLPPEVLQKVFGSALQSMLLMVVIGVPLYVCAEASTPIAAAMILQGLNPGAALVFLLVGPATNLGSLGVLNRQLGRRTVVVYLIAIIVVALVMGAWFNSVLAETDIVSSIQVMDEPFVPSWLKTLAALLFLLVGFASLRRTRCADRLANWLNLYLPVRISPGRLKCAVALVLFVAFWASGWFTVRPGEVALVRQFGAVSASDLSSGLHYAWPYPVSQVDIVPVQHVQRMLIGKHDENQASQWSLVGDENIAAMQFAVHWGAAPTGVVDYQYGSADRKDLLRNVVFGAVQQVMGSTSINTVFTADRQRREEEIEQVIQRRLDTYESGIRIHAFHVLDAHAPPAVHEAFRDVASALEDRSTRINKARAMEAQLVPNARGEAAIRVAEAHAYHEETVRQAQAEANQFLELLGVYQENPQVTERRLEYETLEQVLPGVSKYISPPAVGAGQLEIWFVRDSEAKEIPLFQSGR